jgi:hypothetical protein
MAYPSPTLGQPGRSGFAPYLQYEPWPSPPASQYSDSTQSSLAGWPTTSSLIGRNRTFINGDMTPRAMSHQDADFSQHNYANIPRQYAHAPLPVGVNRNMVQLFPSFDEHHQGSVIHYEQYDQLSMNNTLDGSHGQSGDSVDQDVGGQYPEHGSLVAGHEGLDWVNSNPSTLIRARKSTSKLANCVGPFEHIPYDIDLTTVEILT